MAIEEHEFQLESSFLDPAVQDDPFESYATLREQCPVYQVPETGLYMVTRYEDVREALTNPETFSSRPGAGAGGANDATKAHAAVLKSEGGKARTLQRTDPPEHTTTRKILGRVLQIETLRR